MKIIDTTLAGTMREAAKVSPRRRVHHCLHESPDDAVQRLVVDMEPGTYIRPHRHKNPAKWELFIVLAGGAAVLLFDDTGRLAERIDIHESGPRYGLEIPAGLWHTLIIEEPGTLLLEVKPGPYVPLIDEDFASWAPAEGEPGAAAYEAALHTLLVGTAVTL